jgi:hypothetical protein
MKEFAISSTNKIASEYYIACYNTASILRITKDECDRLFSEEGFRLINGYFVNHTYFPYLRMFPYVYVFINRILSTITLETYSRLYASMYLGVYQK